MDLRAGIDPGAESPLVSPGAASLTNHRNQSLVLLLESHGRLYADPAEAVDLYTRQSCPTVTTRDRR